MLKLSRYLLLLVLAAALSVPASAGVIFSNIGPGDAYDVADGWTLGSGGAIQGDQFQATVTAALASIELAVGLIDGSNELDVWLKEDSAGAPGATIEAFHFSNAMGPFGDANPLLFANSVLNPILTAGSYYWLIATTTDPDAWAVWNYNSLPVLDQGQHFYSDPGGDVISTDTRGAFRLNPVPEPGTFSLLLAGVALLAAKMVRR